MLFCRGLEHLPKLASLEKTCCVDVTRAPGVGYQQRHLRTAGDAKGHAGTLLGLIVGDVVSVHVPERRRDQIHRARVE